MISRRGWLGCAVCLFLTSLLSACAGVPANTNAVDLSPKGSVTIDQGESVAISATVNNGTAGVTWSLSPSSGAGSLMGSTTTSTKYLAPATVAGAVTVTVTATSVAHTDKSASLQITVQPGPSIPATTLPTGSVGGSYTATVTATGGIAPYTWALASGSLPAGLSLASSSTASATISGTPTTKGTSTFTLSVTDGGGLKATSPTLTITINAAPPQDLSLLNGSYAFEFIGYNSGGLVVSAGTFSADGNGNLTAGLEDSNAISGSPATQTFTGTYTLGTDGRGTLTFKLPGSTPVYAFSIDSFGINGRMIEFDSSGVRGSGRIAQQTVTSCGASTINGSYAFGVKGFASSLSGNAGPLAVAGAFTATPPAGAGVPGAISTGELDANIPGVTNSGAGTATPFSVSGTYQNTSQSERCTLSLTPAGVSTLDFAVYPVSGSEFFLIETDQANVSGSTPYISAGNMLLQISGPPFTPTDLFTSTSVAGIAGQLLSTSTNSYVPDVSVAQITGTGSGDFALSLVENQGGSVASTLVNNAPIALTGNVDPFGRVSTDVVSPINPVFYMIDTNEAFVIGMIPDDPLLGLFEPQTVTNALPATSFYGTSFETTPLVPDYSGVLTIANTGTVGGTQDTSLSTGNNSGQGVIGQASITDATLGAGTLALTAPQALAGQFFVVSSTKFVVITVTAADGNPVLIIVGE